MYKEIQMGSGASLIWLAASSSLTKYLHIFSYMRNPFLIYVLYDFAHDPFLIYL
jgi:hypothetical protein